MEEGSNSSTSRRTYKQLTWDVAGSYMAITLYCPTVEVDNILDSIAASIKLGFKLLSWHRIVAKAMKIKKLLM